jgi:hypothetical protein
VGCLALLDFDNNLLCNSIVFRRCLREEWDFSTLPIVDDGATDIVAVSVATLLQFSGLLGDLLDEVLGVDPGVDSKDVDDVLGCNSIEDGLDVALGVRDFLGTHHSLEDFVSIRLAHIIDDSWAVDEVDALGQGDVLPHFGLAWNGRNSAASLLHQGVDHAGLAHVGVPDETHRDALLLLVKHVELLEQLDERTFTEGVGETSLESESRREVLKVLHPLLSHRRWHKIALVENKDEMLGGAILLQMFLEGFGARAVGVSGIKNVDQHV